MLRFKKVLCGSLAALMAMSTTAIVAQAEETEQVKLKTVSVSEICGEDGFTYYLGGNCFTDSKGNIYMLDDKALDDWKKTGKAKFTKLSCDTDISGMVNWSGNLDDGYFQFAKLDADSNVTERKVVHLDKASGAVKQAYTLPTEWSFTNPDGYTISFVDTSPKTVDVMVYDPTGKKTTKTFTFDGNGYAWFNGGAAKGGEYVGYFMWMSSSDDVEEYGSTFTVYGYEVYGVKRNGELEQIYKKDRTYGFGYYGSAENCIVWGDQSAASPIGYMLYSTENKKTYAIGEFFFYGKVGDPGFYSMTIDDISGRVYGDKVIVYCETGSGDEDIRYALLKLNEDSAAELVSKQYKRMSTEDGKIYLVQTDDGKWGYIDSNGKELAIFDDASAFIGDYAPVVMNGKGYIIDRNMNKVSDEVAADGVTTMSKEVFRFMSGNKATLVTYAASESQPDETSSVPTSSEPTSSAPSEPESSAPVSSDTTSSDTTGGNDNPNSGAVMALIPAALIGGAAVVVSKKRKR